MKSLFAAAVGLAILVGAGTSEAIHKRGQPARKARGNVNPIAQQQQFLQSLGITGAVNYPGPAGGKGVRVQSVLPGSKADQAGLEAGDIIFQVDNVNFATTNALQELNDKLKNDFMTMEFNPPLGVVDVRTGMPTTMPVVINVKVGP